MTCTRCGRHINHGEMLCINCGEPTVSAVSPNVRERPSDIVSCLVIGLFVIFGVPALLFGGYLLALGTGVVGSKGKLVGNGEPTVIVAAIPLGVFLTLLFILLKVGIANRKK